MVYDKLAPRQWSLKALLCAFFVVAPCLLLAQIPSNETAIVDGSGQQSFGGTISNISAVGQAGGIAILAGGSYEQAAGFLNRILLHPSLDLDSDGLPDEIDSDNDNDGLADALELSGEVFSPVTPTDLNDADSDDDGASDGAESIAGTHPGSAESVFLITDVSITTQGVVVITWRSRGGKSYDVLMRSTLVTNNWQLIATTNVSGGIPPWFETATVFTDTNSVAAGLGFYSIRVK